MLVIALGESEAPLGDEDRVDLRTPADLVVDTGGLRHVARVDVAHVRHVGIVYGIVRCGADHLRKPGAAHPL